ncbi:hypothetical protein SAMN02745883_01094 [Caminicella sporogenes DSM 14501]|uniref:Uncharacterized protein n=1 Tax=Caminicella sporogenes DSM 14501 TaxID=1121266 RepID=A0A1M6P3V8_9FIRM|nr:hypothetical protein [Caminicella sporogenes]RKD21540.1 hypothetical protein BET04_07375 [Caminicella sporogenes]WIF94184.1 hypothetical protein QNI18_07675 [Caminicella sporogenes]SHK02590.1 hypothetical protein SAMN02745883_01094 [Caminicella sporogenes DSM 14501]
MNFFTLKESLGPRFIIFDYFIKWYLKHFGLFSYIFVLIGSITTLLGYFIYLNLKKNEKDRVLMIVIFGLILVIGLLGIGLDIVHTM